MISAIGSDVATWHPPPPSYEMHGRTHSRLGLTPHAGPARRPAADRPSTHAGGGRPRRSRTSRERAGAEGRLAVGSPLERSACRGGREARRVAPLRQPADRHVGGRSDQAAHSSRDFEAHIRACRVVQARELERSRAQTRLRGVPNLDRNRRRDGRRLPAHALVLSESPKDVLGEH